MLPHASKVRSVASLKVPLPDSIGSPEWDVLAVDAQWTVAMLRL